MSTKNESTAVVGQSIYPCAECGEFNVQPKKKYTDLFQRTAWMKYCQACAISVRNHWINKNYTAKKMESKKRKRTDVMLERTMTITNHVNAQIILMEKNLQQLKNAMTCLREEHDDMIKELEE